MSKELYAQSSLHRMVRYDARSEILTSLGDLSGLRLRGNQVLVAPYAQSGIRWNNKLGFPLEERLSVDSLCDLYNSKSIFAVRDYRSAEESIWQGKVCLVVAVGDEVSERTQIGKWVFTLQENTRGVGLQGVNPGVSRVLKEIGSNGHEGASYEGGWPCRFVYETDIYGDVDDPDMVV